MTPKANLTKRAATAAIVATLLFSSSAHGVPGYRGSESMIEEKVVARKHYKRVCREYKSTMSKVFKESRDYAAVGPYPQFFFPGG